MNKDKKIQIAKDFISKHKVNDVDDWTPFDLVDDKKYIEIYDILLTGLFGEIRPDETDNNYSQIEISGQDSITGNPIIFTWSNEHELSIKRKTRLGEDWAEVLMLKKSKEHKDRYLTTWGDKTALGIYETITRLANQD